MDYPACCSVVTVDRYNNAMSNGNDHVYVYSPEIWPLSPQSSTMQRFLSEPENTLFKPYFSEHEQHTMPPFPDLPCVFHSRLPSPEHSSFDSSYGSSGWDDRQESPYSPPNITGSPYSPDALYNDSLSYGWGVHPPLERHDSHSGGNCVSMHDVQKCADQQPEAIRFEDEPSGYSTYRSLPQEGYQPLQPADEVNPDVSYRTLDPEFCISQASPCHGSQSPVIRRRRAQISRPNNSTVIGARVSKRPNAGRRQSSGQSDDKVEDSSCSTYKPFPCPQAIYGCTATFGSKNEWKRHVGTQHMRLGYWRCDQCTTANGERKINDFNRKDLFTQHVRRMHTNDASCTPTSRKSSLKPAKGLSEEQALQQAASRCYRPLRSPPEESKCLFCDQKFHGQGSWDDRMEHIGRHMEVNKKEAGDPIRPQDWRLDELAQAWMIEHAIIVRDSDGRWVNAS